MSVSLRTPVRAVLFDAVGTLLFPVEPVAATYRRLAQPLGSQLREDEIAQGFVAALAGDAAREETSELLEQQHWRRVVALSLPDLASDAVDLLFEQLWQYYASPRAWLLLPEVAGVWQRLAAAGFKLGIASNFDQRLHEVRGGHPPLDEADWCFVSSEIGYRKPSPRFFKSIGERLGLQPREILLVGDDARLDVQPARASGWQAVHAQGSRDWLAELAQYTSDGTFRPADRTNGTDETDGTH